MPITARDIAVDDYVEESITIKIILPVITYCIPINVLFIYNLPFNYKNIIVI